VYYSSSGIGFNLLFANFAPLRRRNTIFSDLADFSIEDYLGLFSHFGVNFTDLFDRKTIHHYFYLKICHTDLLFDKSYIPYYFTSCSSEGVNFIAMTKAIILKLFF